MHGNWYAADFQNGMTGPTRPMYGALVAQGISRTGFGTHSTP
eukprot:SAG31_NODE_44529_length_262_cov_0.944785_1_plen_41_part_01